MSAKPDRKELAKKSQNFFLKLIDRIASNDPTLTSLSINSWWWEKDGHPSGPEATTKALIDALKKNRTLVVLTYDHVSDERKKDLKRFFLSFVELLKNNCSLIKLVFDNFEFFDEDCARGLSSALEVNENLLHLVFWEKVSVSAKSAKLLAKSLMKNRTLLGFSIPQRSYNTEGFWGNDKLDGEVYEAFKNTLKHNHSLQWLRVFEKGWRWGVKDASLVMENGHYTQKILLELELLVAVELGDLAKVVELHEKGVSVCSAFYSEPCGGGSNDHFRGHGGYTPLMLAIRPIRFKHAVIVKNADDVNFYLGNSKGYLDSPTVVMLRKEGFMTAYWIEDSAIVSRSLPEKEVSEIILDLPNPERSGSHLPSSLIEKIISKYPAVKSTKLVEWLLEHDTFPIAVAPSPESIRKIDMNELRNWPNFPSVSDHIKKSEFIRGYPNYWVGKFYGHSIHPSHAGKTALQMAQQYGFTEIVSAIKKAIAAGPGHVPEQKAVIPFSPTVKDITVPVKVTQSASTDNSSAISQDSKQQREVKKSVEPIVSSVAMGKSLKKDGDVVPASISSHPMTSPKKEKAENQSSSSISTSQDSKQQREVKKSVEPIVSAVAVDKGLKKDEVVVPASISSYPMTPPKKEKADNQSSSSTSLTTNKPTAVVTSTTASLSPKELDRWRSVFPDAQRELSELRQQASTFSMEQFGMLLEQVASIAPEVEALKQRQRLLDQRLNQDPESRRQLQYIASNPKLNNYYQMARKLSCHFVAAQVITSGRVAQDQDGVDLMISGAAKLGQSIPGISILTTVLEQGALVAKGISKYRAMVKLAGWVPDTTSGDRLAELFSRHLTLAKAAEIEAPKKSLDKHTSRGLVERICAAGKAVYEGANYLVAESKQAYREMKENHTYTPEERLALADTFTVLEAILSSKIEAVRGLTSDEQVEQHLVLMMNIFSVTPQSGENLSLSTKVPPKPLSNTVTFASSSSGQSMSQSNSNPLPPQSTPEQGVAYAALMAKIAKMEEERAAEKEEMKRMTQELTAQALKTEQLLREAQKKSMPSGDNEVDVSDGNMTQVQLRSTVSEHKKSGTNSTRQFEYDRRLETIERHVEVLLEGQGVKVVHKETEVIASNAIREALLGEVAPPVIPTRTSPMQDNGGLMGQSSFSFNFHRERLKVGSNLAPVSSENNKSDVNKNKR